MDRIVISSDEVLKVPEPETGAPNLALPLPAAIPLWSRIALAPLVIILPLLSLVALIIRLAARKQTPRQRQAWSSYLLTSLIVSGFVTPLMVLVGLSLSWAPAPDMVASGLSALDERNDFPVLPASAVMSGVQLSNTLRPLVLLASPSAKRWFGHSETTSGLLGAAMILEADEHGYLLATARHVADGPSWRTKSGPQKVMVSDGMDGWAAAQVVGRHKQLDVAVLWLERREGGSTVFRQPVARYKSVQVGERIYVIGHPEGLNFSVSNGIISRMPGSDILQISAPVSPGNSGGPVYDELGNLLGVVTSKFARSVEPEAENLNFAVSTESLLHESDWDMVNTTGPGKTAFDDFLHQTKVRDSADAAQSKGGF